MNPAATAPPDLRRAFAGYTLAGGIHNAKVACVLVMALMPIGYVLDRFVYPAQTEYLFILRLMGSACAVLVWVGLRQPGLANWQYRVLCQGWYVVPALFISWMIAETEGVNSPYYAGLNLVILAVSSVIQATMIESIIAVTLVSALYLSACFGFHHSGVTDGRLFVNNSFFILNTSAIVITGNFFFNRLRYREFVLRCELDENHRQMEESNRKLVEAGEMRVRFFANISHELRTPLTLLLAPLETLLTRYGRSFDDASRQLLQTMHGNGMRLLKLINDLLDLVRADSGVMQVRREPVEVAEFLHGLATAARQMAEDKRIRLHAHVEPDVGAVMVDHDKLEKIILNLQFNALKFTPAGGSVDLRARKDGEHLILDVTDTGMGIAEKNLSNVFDRFWQADGSARRKYQGVGIGLALVKELVEVQGGRVSVQSHEGQGTTFTVRLPYLKPDPEAAAAASPAGTHSVPPGAGASAAPATPAPETATGSVSSEEWLTSLYRRAELFPAIVSVHESVRRDETSKSRNLPVVLIADDEPDMLGFLKSQLVEHYNILEAVDGQQAIDKAAQFLPDVILLDMMMPEKDGLQACREIRRHTSTQGIPIVLLTARADEQTKLDALSAGASDFLPKPFSTTELHVRVKNLVDTYTYQRKLARKNQMLEATVEQLKETETHLVQSEKLASLGRLSAGIIHEINNPLNFATTGLYTLRNKGRALAPEQQEEFTETLNDIEDGIKRVKTIVSDLRSFSHPDTESVDEVRVQSLVDTALRFLSHEWKDRVRVEIDLPQDQTVRGNENKLVQVVLNLLQNSLDALKSKPFTGGQEPLLRIEGRVERGRSHLRVRDNGEGIAPEHLDKIFDPFFTTKDVGQGTGLGLSICYRIVQDFGGRITVRSERGQYTEFTLDFPTGIPAPAAELAGKHP